MKSALLCGVGGQGTVLASRIIAQAAMDSGRQARTAETIGMAQRGGAVVSHVRIGETPEEAVTSPLIPDGQADVLIGFEPGEAARNLKALKPDGIVIVNRRAIVPVTASLGKSGYDGETVLKWLEANAAHCFVVDGDQAAQACGSEKVLNVVLTGALAATGAMGLSFEAIKEAMIRRVKPAFVEMNKKALALGAEMVRR
ncbi:indolepyruvate oxidoreductase subunit beta [Pseudoramibacter porci]|uniref:Indolepyruvate oxidoreductase subunit beta n=1 Tax=Pseudoramibacter porci TaxID=2606631 RepID=A0A7X2T9M4_9FIRM|nr:indolepyruvate oxidoreductase subunit beta [Pseudoramibacter porci]MSS19689.1 indolepyruvate oxidoreductase subunit beta [Pseudoramibacter porci]